MTSKRLAGPLTWLLAPALFVIVLAWPSAASAKEFDIEGTIDCNQPSGKTCLPLGLQIGVLTESISGRRETVQVSLAWVVEAKLKKLGKADLLTLDPQVSRAMVFGQLQEVKGRIQELGLDNPGRLTGDDLSRLTDTLLDRGLPREVAANRDMLFLVVRSLKQDAPVSLTVRDDVLPIPMVISVNDRFDFLTSRSEGSLNKGNLTGSDPDRDLCFDFVQETLDWARDKVQKDGRFELNDLEEQFFDIVADLPNPCDGYEAALTVFLENYAKNLIKSAANDIRPNIKNFVNKNPELRRKLLAILLETGLKQRDSSDHKFRDLIRQLDRRD
jgi:hypothetical protein